MTESRQPTDRAAVIWSWPHALIGVAYAIPAAVVALHDPAVGVPLAVGVLPAAIVGIPDRRAARIIILVIGILAGASLFFGGVLAHLPLAGTAALLVATVIGAALLASALPAGRVVLVLCAPLVAAGLSYTDYTSSAATFLLLSLGAGYAYLVALLWPARSASERPQTPLPPRAAMLDYGIRMGLAAAIVYGIAASLDLDHPGWAPAACLLVARPQLNLLQSRGLGRVLSVIIGALLGALLLKADPSNLTFAIIAIAVLAAAAATAGSRWYITSAFTTLLVFLMLFNGHLDQTTAKFNERVGETILGVIAAYLFGWASRPPRPTPNTELGHRGVRRRSLPVTSVHDRVLACADADRLPFLRWLPDQPPVWRIGFLFCRATSCAFGGHPGCGSRRRSRPRRWQRSTS